MTCEELAGFLADYLDGLLPEGVRARFEEHLGCCAECVVYLETYREAVRLGKDAFAEEGAPAEVPERLVRAILAAQERKAPPRALE